jgi:hypothetical protein
MQCISTTTGTGSDSGTQDDVTASYDLTTNLEALIRDFVEYGAAKEKVDRRADNLELPRS